MSVDLSLHVARASAAALLGAAVAASPAGAAPAQPSLAAEDIPVLGQTVTMGTRTEGEPLILTVHGVRRTDGATIVYYSGGLPANAPAPGMGEILGWPNGKFIARTYWLPHCDVGLLSQSDSTVYAPLDDSRICSPIPRFEPGVAHVAAVAVAPVPAEVDVVDVSIHGSLITDVPVEDGLLEPAAEDQGSAPVLGMGWPTLARDRIAAADPVVAIFPLTQAVRDVEGEVTETETTFEISGDVLFDKHSYTIDAAGRAVLAKATADLRDKEITGTLWVIGHTDSDGEAGYNQTLSENRANSVATALRELLGADVTIEAEGRGEDDPIASNETAQGKALNRRVTLDYGNGAN